MQSMKSTLEAGQRVAARTTSRVRLLPSFLIIGAKRAGTTSLYEYIVEHPGVVRSRLPKGSHYFDVRFSRGWNWYRSTFPLAINQRAITGEASPYYLFHPLAPRRIAAALPDTRLIAILRDPVDRAYSQYQFERRGGFEELPLEQALDREPERLAGEAERMVNEPGYESFAYRHHGYLARGRYAEQLERLYELVSPSRVLLLQSELLLADPNAVLDRVWRFLDLPPHAIYHAQLLDSGSYAPMPDTIRERLQQYYHSHNRRLYELPGVDFRWPTA
jgi:sulfotransferase family protein